MSQVFVTSKSSVTRHGVFAIAQTSPTALRAQGTGTVGYAGQFPWGPPQTVSQVFGSGDIGAMLKLYAPAGMTRTGSAYLGLIGLMPPGIKLLRVMGAGGVAASVMLKDGLVDVVKLTLKYPGVEGNNVTVTVKGATDGDPNHVDLEITVTSASGTTTDTVKNYNASANSPESIVDTTRAVLLGSVEKLADGVPDTGTFSFAHGTTPAVLSSDYLGTQGTSDKGVALFEGHDEIRHVVTDDTGNALRAAVNAGLIAHAAFMGNRIAYVNGNSGLDVAATNTDVQNYRTRWGQYVDPWYSKRDDVDGTLRLVPPAVLKAKVAASTSPSTSNAWKDPEQIEKLAEIVELESNRGAAAGTNTQNGIVTIIKEENGGHSFEADILTIAPMDEATKNATRQRMGIYLATTFVQGNRRNVDAPNVELVQDDVALSWFRFLSGLLANKNVDPWHSPYIAGFTVAAPSAVNSEDDIAGGDYNVASDVRIGPSMERIFLLLNFGERVKVTFK
jgi:phage tail sheath protein FI